MNSKSLNYIKIKHVIKILDECKGNKNAAARILETSTRNLLNILIEAEEKYGIKREIKVSSAVMSEIKSYKIFPTNKERLEHMDKMSNRYQYYKQAK